MSAPPSLPPSGFDGPYTDPGLQANLFFRVFLGIIAVFACWVPGKLLWKNGELAAVVFCINVSVFNLLCVVNALIWPNNNTSSWWMGYGWCDLQMYLIFPLETQYAACVFAIMRHLAQQVGLMRASSLTNTEKRRRNLIQALILFPIPMLQVALTYLVLTQRYLILTLVGCVNAYDESWPYLVFFVLPAPIFTVGASYYAVLTWMRFRELDKTARETLDPSSNTIAARRQQRIRRKLFYMSAAILIPYMPVELLFFSNNVIKGVPWTKPYDFNQIHYRLDPIPWSYIGFITTDLVNFAQLNGSYISILTVIPIFWSFGMTKEAINTYRTYLLAIGLGRFLPRLHEEYDPDSSASTSGSWSNALSNLFRSHKAFNSSQVRSQQDTATTSANRVQRSQTSMAVNDSSPANDDITLHDIPGGHNPVVNEETGHAWRLITAPSSSVDQSTTASLPHRGLRALRTTLASNPLRLPPMTFSGIRKKGSTADARLPTSATESTHHLVSQSSHATSNDGHAASVWTGGPSDHAVQTQVWSARELHPPASPQLSPSVVEAGNGVTVRTDIARSSQGVQK